MGKRKADDGVQEIAEFDKETTVFINCRKYSGMTEKSIKGQVESHGFSVKLVRKTLKHRHALVDMGSVEAAKELIKKLNHSSFKGQGVIADFMKKNKKVDEKPKKANMNTLSILDRLLCIRGISKFVSKKTITSLFKDVESIIIPSQKGTELRDVLVVFHKPSQAAKAVKEYQGCELAGTKLILETLVAVPAEVKEGCLDDEDEPKNNKKDAKKEKKNDKEKKVEVEMMEVEEDEDDEEEDDDDDDEDDEEEEDEEDDEVVKPPKKIPRKK